LSAAGRSRSQLPVAVLIIAGGRGTRFWPLSRGNRPKPLFSLDGKTTLLGETVARARMLTATDRIFVLIAKGQERAFRAALRGLIPLSNLIVEPAARGTAVAIAYGAALIERRLGAVVVAVMPADHLISPPRRFQRTLTAAIGLAAKHGAVVVIGVEPTRVEPGYGYQKIGRRIGAGYEVERFVEKPPPAVAAKMVRSGRFLWNAGMFVMSTATLAAELAEHCPALAAAMKKIATAPAIFARAYARLNFDAFDREVAERSRRVISVRAQFRWHDVGSWDGLWEAMRVRKGRAAGGNVLTGNVIALKTDGVFAHAHGRLMVLMGVDDLVVVDSGDAILIARRSQSQNLRVVTEELKRRGLDRYL
jgi:mannose-1-phosphate guanylyltransferase